MLRDFTDSTAIAGDGPALAARLERDGYLFIRGLLPRAAVAEVRAQFLDLAARGGWLAAGHPVEAAIASSTGSVDNTGPSVQYRRRPSADQ